MTLTCDSPRLAQSLFHVHLPLSMPTGLKVAPCVCMVWPRSRFLGFCISPVTPHPLSIIQNRAELIRQQNNMPRGRLIRVRWDESQDQHTTLHIPCLLRVWRTNSDHQPRGDQPSRSDLSDTYSRQGYSRDHRGRPNYHRDDQPSNLNTPSPFDSWEQLRDSLPFEEGQYQPRASPSHEFDNVQPRYEIRQPAWADEEPETHSPSTSSRYTDMDPRYEGRGTRRAYNYADSEVNSYYDRQPRFAGPTSSASEYSYSDIDSPQASSHNLTQGGYTTRPSRHEEYSGDEGRSFGHEVPPFAPDPPSRSSTTHADYRYFQSHTRRHARRNRYPR